MIKQILVFIAFFLCSICNNVLFGSAAFTSALASARWVKKDKIKKELNLSDADKEIEAIVAQGIEDMGIKEDVFVLKGPSCKKLDDETFELTMSHPAKKNRFNEHYIVYYPNPQFTTSHWKFMMYHELAHIKNKEHEEEILDGAKKCCNNARKLSRTYLAGTWIAFISWLKSNFSKHQNHVKPPLQKAYQPIKPSLQRAFPEIATCCLKANRELEACADGTAMHTLLKKKDYVPIINVIAYTFALNKYNPCYYDEDNDPSPSPLARHDAARYALINSGLIWTKKLYHESLKSVHYRPIPACYVEGIVDLNRDFMQRQHGIGILPVHKLLPENRRNLKQQVLDGTLRGSVYNNAWLRK